MRILAIIPARQGSKRLQGKNLLPVGGKPLVQWSIERALMTEAFVDVLVSSDDPVVVDLANQIGGLAPWLRPEHLATDSASTASVLQHALTWYESEFGGVDAVALLQPTSPFRSVETMRSAVAQYCSQAVGEVHPVVSVSPVVHHPAWCFRLSQGEMSPILGWDQIRTRTQDLEPMYSLNGVVYIFPAERVRLGGSLLCSGCKPYVINDLEEALDIDTELQLNVAEIVAQRRRLK